MSRIFSDWLKTFRNSINSYSYYIDFKKVYRQAENIKLEINLLNSLVGSREIEEDFEKLLRKYPECLKAIPFLLAVRQNK
ncbi:DpnII family type II restriction endonuclease, partial [Turicimonas muris]